MDALVKVTAFAQVKCILGIDTLMGPRSLITSPAHGQGFVPVSIWSQV